MAITIVFIVQIMFGAALFLNAFIFFPQALRIFREKSAKGVSLLTFSGILYCQLAMLFHGLVIKDHLFILGYAISLFSCSMVVLLIFFYRKK